MSHAFNHINACHLYFFFFFFFSISNKRTRSFFAVSARIIGSMAEWHENMAWRMNHESINWNVCQGSRLHMPAIFVPTISIDRTIKCKQETCQWWDSKNGWQRRLRIYWMDIRFEVESDVFCIKGMKMMSIWDDNRYVWTNKIIDGGAGHSSDRLHTTLASVSFKHEHETNVVGLKWRKNSITFRNSIAKWHQTEHLCFTLYTHWHSQPTPFATVLP